MRLVGRVPPVASRTAAAAASALAAPEIERLRGLATAREGKARDHHPGLGRLACGAHLSRVPFGEPGEDVKALCAALAPILIDRHVVTDSKARMLLLAKLMSEWVGTLG